VAADGEWKHPPDGVPTEPEPGRDFVPLSRAAQHAHVDRRTLQAAVVKGETAGWARPGPGKLRWFVYEDALPSSPGREQVDELTQLRAELTALRAEVAALRRSGPGEDAGVVADLRARLVSVEETNLLLIEAHEDLESASGKYRRALGLFMTPGHPGDLTQQPQRPRN
jgi:hypothetical protein